MQNFKRKSYVAENLRPKRAVVIEFRHVKPKNFSKISRGVKNTTISTTFAIGEDELRPSFFVSLKCYFEEAKTFG